MFGDIKKKCIFAASNEDHVQWCNGSTTVFGTVCLGSNPGWTTEVTLTHLVGVFYKREKRGGECPLYLFIKLKIKILTIAK